MFADTSLWLMLGSMASTAGLLGLWFDGGSGDQQSGDRWPPSELD